MDILLTFKQTKRKRTNHQTVQILPRAVFCRFLKTSIKHKSHIETILSHTEELREVKVHAMGVCDQEDPLGVVLEQVLTFGIIHDVHNLK